MGQAGWNLSATDSCLEPEPLDELRPLVPSPGVAPPIPAILRSLDLRVHAPIPEVVIVRVSGAVDGLTATVLAERVDKQLTRASHVVVDLGEVAAVDPRGLALLRLLCDKATATGTEIHIATAERDDVQEALRSTGLDQLFILDPTAEWVIAEVLAERHAAVVRRLSPPRPSGSG